MKTYFGPGGCFQAHDSRFSYRPGQLQMAEAVQQAIAEGSHLAVEGGTGVGKSLAYLAPALLAAWEQGKKVMISTWSISLQQQLVEKDLPWLEKQLGRQIDWVLAKGRHNYLSRRRLRLWLETVPNLFEEEPYAQKLIDWVETTSDGALSDWPTVMDHGIWEEVVSDRDNCLGRRCGHYNSCFFYEARRALDSAQLVVVNHALFFSHLALGVEGFLPKCDVLIFDEAHQIEATASEHLGFRLTQGDFSRFCDRLNGRRGRGGLLSRYGLAGRELVEEIRQSAKRLFQDLRHCAHQQETFRFKQPPEVANFLHGPLTELDAFLKTAAENVGEDARLELKSQRRKARTLQMAIERFLKLEDSRYVYWLEGNRRLQLVAAPVDVGPILKESLFAVPDQVCVMTSATLSQAGSFEYFSQRLHFEGRCLMVPSPFDYEKQMDLIFDTRLGDPRDKNYPHQLLTALKDHLNQAPRGGVFVLFTSHQTLGDMAKELEPWLQERGRVALIQGRDGSDRRLIESFKKEGNAVLLGTDRFWTGVDVPGDALETVIITKLPFQYPDHPLNQARCELIEEQGGSSFRDFILPQAILKLRQGLGRLIRQKSDLGRVVILDGRVVSKSYGTLIRRALPHRGRLWGSSKKLENQ